MNKTPFEIFFGKKPSLKYLRLYGSKIFVKTSEEKRHSKWERKADLGISVGYDNVGYRVLIDQKIVIAMHVNIVEDGVKLVGIDSDEGSYNESVVNESLNDDEVLTTKLIIKR